MLTAADRKLATLEAEVNALGYIMK